MKVLYITPYPPMTSGQSHYAAAFRKCLQTHACIEVDVLPMTDPEYNIAKVAEYYALAREDVLANPGKWATYDLIHIEIAANNYREYYYAHFLARYVPNVPLCLTVHDSPALLDAPFLFLIPRSMPRPIRAFRRLLDLTIGRRWDREIVERTIRIFVLTQKGAMALARQYTHIPADRTGIISHISYQPTDEILKAPPHDYVQHKIEILFFGYVSPGKGIEGLIKAYALLLGEGSQYREDTTLSICGDMPFYLKGSSKGSYLQTLKDLVTSLHLDGNVGFKGYVPERGIDDIFRQAAIIVLPYLEDGNCGYSGPLLWAMTEGVPVIASNTRAFSEDIIDGETGLLFPAGDVEQLAQQLKQLVDSNRIRSKLGRAAKDHITTEHSWSKVAGTVRSKYETALAGTHVSE